MTQIAIVTGGASGIGLALGTALVQRGWHVVLDDIQAVKAKDEAERLTRVGPGTAIAAGVDVRDADPLIALVRDTHAEHGRLDLMVNNAGIGVVGEPDELDVVHWDTVIDTNLRGVIHGCHAAYPLMKQQRSGTILNTASMAGLFPPSSTMTPVLDHQVRGRGAEPGPAVSRRGVRREGQRPLPGLHRHTDARRQDARRPACPTVDAGRAVPATGSCRGEDDDLPG